jgi:hypothetical protein
VQLPSSGDLDSRQIPRKKLPTVISSSPTCRPFSSSPLSVCYQLRKFASCPMANMLSAVVYYRSALSQIRVQTTSTLSSKEHTRQDRAQSIEQLLLLFWCGGKNNIDESKIGADKLNLRQFRLFVSVSKSLQSYGDVPRILFLCAGGEKESITELHMAHQGNPGFVESVSKSNFRATCARKLFFH